jgi:acyl carrier protein
MARESLHRQIPEQSKVRLHQWQRGETSDCQPNGAFLLGCFPNKMFVQMGGVRMTQEDILNYIYEGLRERQTDTRVILSAEWADQTTVEALVLDSLDMLQFLMDLEEKLGVPLEVTTFPRTSTLAEVAGHIFRLKKERLEDIR